MQILFGYECFKNEILNQLYHGMFGLYPENTLEKLILEKWDDLNKNKENIHGSSDLQEHIPIILPLSYYVFVNDDHLTAFERGCESVEKPEPRDYFIWETLGAEFSDLKLTKNLSEIEKPPLRIYFEKLLIAYCEYKSNSMDKDIYDYYVSEAILEFVKHLLLKLNFTDGLAYDLLKAWQSYEELLYSQKKFYREHFIHQFQDFLLGCLFLGNLWEKFSMYYEKRRFLRRWFFASIFHDIGYPAETLGSLKNTLNEKIFNKIPNYAVKKIDLETFNSDENLPLLIRNLALIHLFSENINIHESNDSGIDKFKYPINEIINLLKDELTQSQDHGVVGALFFLKTALIDLREVVVDPSTFHLTTIFTEYEPYPHLIDDLFVSAAAIAGHNLRTKVYPSYTVDFSSRPIAALLNFCDDLQEWDRRFLKPYPKEFMCKNWKNNNQNDDRISKWDIGSIYPISVIINNNKELEIEFVSKNKDKRDGENLKYFNESLKRLFETNLGDLNASFFKKITIKGICPDRKKSSAENENTEIKNTPIIIELITRNDNLKSYHHMIGRYLINPQKTKIEPNTKPSLNNHIDVAKNKHKRKVK
jgi:hypothetical protein